MHLPPARRGPRLYALAAAVLAVTAVPPPEAHAWAIGSQLDETGCHEPITAAALRAVRARFDTAPVIPPSRDEAALIADAVFSPPPDLVGDLAGMALLFGVRDNDLKGIDPLSSLDLIQVHGNPETQDEHCIRVPGDDGAPAGDAAAIAACRAFIASTATAALDGLDPAGRVDPARRTELPLYMAIRGRVTPMLPLFYVKIGAAMHALEDGFPHTYRTADGTRITTVLNWIDLVGGHYDEPRDGPGHRAELDRCWDASDPTIHRNYELATQAATDLLAAALDPALGRDAKIQQFDAVTARYLAYQPGCAFDNQWCDPPEAHVTNSRATSATAGERERRAGRPPRPQPAGERSRSSSATATSEATTRSATDAICQREPASASSLPPGPPGRRRDRMLSAMPTMPTGKAIDRVRRLLKRAEDLKATSSDDEVYRLWRNEANDAVRNIFGEDSPQYKRFSHIMFHSVHVPFMGWDSPHIDRREESIHFKRGLQTAKIQLTAMIAEVESVWPDEAARPEPRAALATVLHICERFPDVVRQLSKRWGKGKRQALRMKDEYDVQYLLGALLVVEFDDVRPEDPAPTHAGAATRRDFVLKSERIVVEAKMTRKTLTAKGVGDELAADIVRYAASGDVDTLVCIVYDPGRHIINPRAIERDLEKTRSKLTVRVLVCV